MDGTSNSITCCMSVELLVTIHDQNGTGTTSRMEKSTGLPESNIFNTILVVTDQLSKAVRVVPGRKVWNTELWTDALWKSIVWD